MGGELFEYKDLSGTRIQSILCASAGPTLSDNPALIKPENFSGRGHMRIFIAIDV